MLFIKLLIMVICSGLFWWGGYSWHNARRFIMPVVLVLTTLFLTNWDWRCFSMLMVIGTLCLGYGEKSPLRHIFGDAWARFVWMILSSFCLSLPLILTGHLNLLIGIIYILLCGTLGITLRKINQIIGDLIFGLGLSSFLIFVH